MEPLVLWFQPDICYLCWRYVQFYLGVLVRKQNTDRNARLCFERYQEEEEEEEEDTETTPPPLRG